MLENGRVKNGILNVSVGSLSFEGVTAGLGFRMVRRSERDSPVARLVMLSVALELG